MIEFKWEKKKKVSIYTVSGVERDYVSEGNAV